MTDESMFEDPTPVCQPLIGNLVHYKDWGYGQTCLAAIIVGEPVGQQQGKIRLSVFNEFAGMFGVWAAEGMGQAQWHWPERD